MVNLGSNALLQLHQSQFNFITFYFITTQGTSHYNSKFLWGLWKLILKKFSYWLPTYLKIFFKTFWTEYLWRIWSLTIFTICSWFSTIKHLKKPCFTELRRVPLHTVLNREQRTQNLLGQVYFDWCLRHTKYTFLLKLTKLHPNKTKPVSPVSRFNFKSSTANISYFTLIANVQYLTPTWMWGSLPLCQEGKPPWVTIVLNVEHFINSSHVLIL